MQIDWLKQDGNERLAVMVLGWACSMKQISHIDAVGYDIVCIYDYRDFKGVLKSNGEEIHGVLAGYRQRILIAWSFGVWAAERLFGNNGICPATFEKASALNGTPFPADERLGIGRRRLSVTLRGLAREGKEAFNRKMYGQWYERFTEKTTGHTVTDNVQELQVLMKLSTEEYTPSICWTSAIVGTGDAIFPPENMLRYWAGKAKSVPLPHYPFGEENIIRGLF